MASASSGTAPEIWHLIHHVFLPPQLPQEDDFKSNLELELLNAATEGLGAFNDITEHRIINSAIAMLDNMRKVHVWDGNFRVDHTGLANTLQELKEGDSIPIYVRAQNAGVLISKEKGYVKFAEFEISPTNEAVMSCKGRLRRTFPGLTVRLTDDKFDDTAFQMSLSDTLSNMSSHGVAGMLPQVRKAKQLHDEDRDTAHPAMVSELLINVLASMGETFTSTTITKNTREEVSYFNARFPWRRSGTWLLIRVVLQMAFSGALESTHLYKSSMLFVMSGVLKLARERSFPSDILYAMSAKLSRRLLKIGSNIDDQIVEYVKNTLRDTHSFVAKVWTNVQNNDARRLDLTRVNSLDFEHDTQVSLPALDDYINMIHNRTDEEISARFQPTSAPTKLVARELPSLTGQSFSNGEHVMVNLQAFEVWVELHCDGWAMSHVSDDTCSRLNSTIKEYHRLCTTRYLQNPEALSVMLLTIYELWIACDKVAIELCPLLAKYNPGIDLGVLQNLLLPFKSQMNRLRLVEKYHTDRCSESSFASDKLFVDVDRADCFAAQYFDQSSEHKSLHQQIINKATQERQEKRIELQQQRTEYQRLSNLSTARECEYVQVRVRRRRNSWLEMQHSHSCLKCSYNNQAENLEIEVHEWPLPSEPIKEKVVIFELNVPAAYGFWRDMTTYVLKEVLHAGYASHPEQGWSQSLQKDSHLSQNWTTSQGQRIGLLTRVKPHVVSHRDAKRVSTVSDQQICVNNGTNYRYYDSAALVFTTKVIFNEKIAELLTYQLPAQSAALQKYLFRPFAQPDGPAPNNVIANQSDCPPHMSIEEYKEFCNLGLGHRIQWYNLLLQLLVPLIDMKKAETSLAILQCLYQAGPMTANSSILRHSHECLDEDDFTTSLLDGLDTALSRVKESWESAQALVTFSDITRRVLSLSSSTSHQQRCLGFLQKLASVAFEWIDNLRSRFQDSVDQEDRAELKSKCVEVALICSLCFDVDDQYLVQVLSNTTEASKFIQCCIMIQEGKPSYAVASKPVLYLMRFRLIRLSYRAYRVLRDDRSSFHDAIQASWSAYQPGGAWEVVSSNFDHWLVTDTALVDCGRTMKVHYNLLSGELLVNGLPLGRPPRNFEDHTFWSVLFGDSAIDVMPSDVSGMRFSAKKRYQGYRVDFGLQKNGSHQSQPPDLCVRASSGEAIYETIPSRLLLGEYPEFFIDKFVHWYSYASGTIQLRPKSDPWNRVTGTALTLSRSHGNSVWTLQKDNECLVGLKSATAKMMADIFSSMADLPKIHVSFSQTKSLIEVEIPSLELGFYSEIDHSILLSREFRGMRVDENQRLGTLIGLSNKLILKSKSDKLDSNRVVLVPEGQISYVQQNAHIQVRVQKNSILRVHALREDTQLGRLMDNGNLHCKLVIAYLHALTAFSLPDPLTRKTGTEQALSILESAAVRSFDSLTQPNIDILKIISRLTPGRCFYPANERVMETVSWDPQLSFLSQHNRFYDVVTSIFHQAMRQNTIYYPKSDVCFPRVDHVNEHLLARDCIRSSTFRVSGYGAEDHKSTNDISYNGRDHDLQSEKAHRAYRLSNIAGNTQEIRHWKAPDVGYLWKSLLNTNEVRHARHSIADSGLRYGPTVGNSGFDFSRWPALHEKFKDQHNKPGKFDFMMWLSKLGSAKECDLMILQVVALMFAADKVRRIQVPDIEVCRPSEGYEVTKKMVENIIRKHLVALEDAPEADMSKHENEGLGEFEKRQERAFQKSQNAAVGRLADHFHRQWPCETLSSIPSNLSTGSDALSKYILLEKALAATKRMFKIWFDNLQLYNYLRLVEVAVSHVSHSPIDLPSWPEGIVDPLPQRAGFVAERNLFAGTAPSLPGAPHGLQPSTGEAKYNKEAMQLNALLDRLQASSGGSEYEAAYIQDLRDSKSSYQLAGSSFSHDPPRIDALYEYLRSCLDHVKAVYRVLELGVNQYHRTSPEQTACIVGQWPRVSPTLFLQQLSDTRWHLLTIGWQDCVLQYALAITALQRAHRLVNAADSEREDDLVNELKNCGHANWNPREHPQTILMEVESGLMIRPQQEQIAAEIRRASSNAVMQLNMGEGKSSVIVPMVAAALAQSSRLIRVVVAKPQSKQMAQMLIAKLGGLIAKRVYFMPFSRAHKLSASAAESVDRIMRECMSNRGVLLVHPEHMLSFKLMGLECYNSGQADVGRVLIRTQDFFDSHSQDIVDESDENFSVKFELIYTMGQQASIELSPDRWIFIQQVFEMVRQFAPQIKKAFPTSVEVRGHRDGYFPKIRILDGGGEAEQSLILAIARRICDHGLDGFPIARQPDRVRQAVLLYLTKLQLTDKEIDEVQTFDLRGFWSAAKSKLLLLRGLLAGGVLGFALSQKRWRVNYGLVTTRSPATELAVPYRAKDSPTPRSEFSHPDVVIVLTSLSYYYGGLEDDDLFTVFNHLLQSDQAAVEYSVWLKDAPGLPNAFCQLEGVNLRDRAQCTREVFPHLKKGKSIIDYFLAHIIFPKQMKEFPQKLSASGWDIGKIKKHPTSGFSGTNDARNLLPLDVLQRDLEEQKHTNALVLDYLLQPVNSVALVARPSSASTSDAEHLLSIVTQFEHQPEVILDVGAQILELTNEQVGRAWLRMLPTSSKEAVVFVNDEDELCVIDRKGRLESLQTSPFASKLDMCFVFLDEAHTRGIDLKLPKHYRAAVTLGANLTKDRLVQACMRMRKLGKGQTVIFCVTEEIQTKIKACTGINPGPHISVADVLFWAISETFAETRRSMPLWAVQGARYLRQSQLWDEVRKNEDTVMSEAQAEKFLEDEAQSVEQRYRPKYASEAKFTLASTSGSQRVSEIQKRCHEFDNLQFDSRTLQEEQERELAPEIEEERQLERPANAEPAKHEVHPDVKKFVSSGMFRQSPGYFPAFNSLKTVSAAHDFQVSQLVGKGPEMLLVTAEFARTVQATGKSFKSDDYQRAVQWLLVNRNGTTDNVTVIMLISPYEAQNLIRLVKASSKTSLHLYRPRCNERHQAFDRLNFLGIPSTTPDLSISSSLRVQLNLFAGQLYFSSYDEYLETCKFLSLATWTPKDGEKVDADGFISRQTQGGLHSSPVKFLHTLLSKVRRNGQVITKTHLGGMLQGRILDRSEFEGEETPN